MIHLVRISRQLVTEGLTLGFKTQSMKILEGLPKGCDLIAANIEANGVLVLSFLHKEGPEHSVVTQNILVETSDSREDER